MVSRTIGSRIFSLISEKHLICPQNSRGSQAYLIRKGFTASEEFHFSRRFIYSNDYKPTCQAQKNAYNKTIMDLTQQVNKLLIEKKLTIAAAESCTGGLVSASLTESPGSSRFFKMGLIAYSNEVKIRRLKINRTIIRNKGAVSKEVALKMATSIRKRSPADIGIGITGIAGPTGSTRRKPIGLVYIAIADNKRKDCWQFNFKGGRRQIRKHATQTALGLIKKWIA